MHFLFKIDLPSQHPLFGDDISVRVAGIDTPELKGSSDEVKALAYKAKNRTQELLSDAKTIELKNPQRDKQSISGGVDRWRVAWREAKKRWIGEGL